MPLKKPIQKLRSLAQTIHSAVPPRVRFIAGLCLVLFAMQAIVARAPVRTVLLMGEADYLLVPDLLTFLFAIHGVGLSIGFFWTPITYMFLHGSVSHLLLNLVGLVTFGSAMEHEFSARTMTAVFILSGMFGGLGWVLANGLASAQPCIGASAGVLGLVGAYAALRPRDRFTIFLPFPLILRAWALASLIFVLNIAELLLGKPHIAYSAHLGGIVVGIVCGLILKPFTLRKQKTSHDTH